MDKRIPRLHRRRAECGLPVHRPVDHLVHQAQHVARGGEGDRAVHHVRVAARHALRALAAEPPLRT
eukprot:1195291-Prorocentrum_minimum.AAC.2